MYRNILVPLDGSRVAESILRRIAGFARDHGAKLTLLGVVHPFGEWLPQPSIGSLRLSGERHEARLMRYLDAVAMFLELGRVEAQPAIVSGHLPLQILAEARERGCDLIALLVHENAVLGRGILGNSADAALGQSDPSLILVFPQSARQCWEPETSMVLSAKE